MGSCLRFGRVPVYLCTKPELTRQSGPGFPLVKTCSRLVLPFFHRWTTLDQVVPDYQGDCKVFIKCFCLVALWQSMVLNDIRGNWMKPYV